MSKYLTERQREHLRLKQLFPDHDDMLPCPQYEQGECTKGKRINRCRWEPVSKSCRDLQVPMTVPELSQSDMRHRDFVSTPRYKRENSWKRRQLDTMPSSPPPGSQKSPTKNVVKDPKSPAKRSPKSPTTHATPRKKSPQKSSRASPSKRSSPSNKDWACERCTFQNEARRKRCAMCRKGRPS